MKNIENQKPILATNNIFDEALEQFKQDALFERLQKKFTPRAYYIKYKNLRLFTLIASYLFNLFSALTASTLIYFFVLSLGPGVLISALSTITFIALLEAFKRKTSSIFFSNLLQFRKVNLIILVVVAISSLSVAFSFFGSKKVVQEFTPPPPLEVVDTLTNDLQKELGTINDQIKEANKTKWKGNTTRTAQKAIEQLSKQKAIIQSEIIRISQRTDESNDSTIIQHKSNVQINSANFALVTLLLEALFLLCAFYIEYYDYRSYAEFAQVQIIPTNPTDRPQFLNGNSNGNGTDKRLNGTETVQPLKLNGTAVASVDTETISKRLCANCSVDISAKKSTAKYCSDLCRRQKWKSKNGRDAYYKEKL